MKHALVIMSGEGSSARQTGKIDPTSLYSRPLRRVVVILTVFRITRFPHVPSMKSKPFSLTVVGINLSDFSISRKTRTSTAFQLSYSPTSKRLQSLLDTTLLKKEEHSQQIPCRLPEILTIAWTWMLKLPSIYRGARNLCHPNLLRGHLRISSNAWRTSSHDLIVSFLDSLIPHPRFQHNHG